MSRATDVVTTTADITQIPSLLTNSCRAFLDAFGTDIIQLKAHGSVATTNQTVVDDLAEYGLIREQETNHRLTIDYTQIQDTNNTGPTNPLTEDAREAIIERIETILSDDASTVDPDLVVTSATIRITDEQLQEATAAVTPEFDLHFVADAAEDEVREQTRRANAGRGLYTELGFKLQNLNLRSVIETKTKYTEQSSGRYLTWQGPKNDVRPQSPDKLAVRINRRVLPDKYGTLKPYRVTEDEVLELVEDELETLAADQQSEFNGENQ